MIIFIQLICSIIQNFISKLKENNIIQEIFYLKSENENAYSGKRYQNIDIEHNLGFNPQEYYAQRYKAVESILLDNIWKGNIKKVVEFGCREINFFLYLKNIHHLEEVLEIDVDENLLRDNLFKVQPLIYDYISKRTTPLTVHVLTGSISDPFIKLIGTDVVIAIEVIEHLYPDVLDALPYNIFNFIKPKMVIFTTPNADFKSFVPFCKENLYNNHKLEWTRKQFRSWARNITVRFPDYSVNFYMIGNGSKGIQNIGCSQMAVFVNSTKMKLCEDNCLHMEGYDLGNNSCSCEKCLLSTSFGVCTDCGCIELFMKSIQLWWNTEEFFPTYKLIDTIHFPFRDYRYHKQKLLDNLVFKRDLQINLDKWFNNDTANKALLLSKFLFDTTFSIKGANKDRQILDDAQYEIEQCPVFNQLHTCVVTEMESDISSSNTSTTTTNDGNGSKNYSEWTTIAESEESDWDTETSTLRSSSWTDITESSQSEAEESASRILDCVINNVNNSVNQNSSKDDQPSDSGYAKSNTIETSSTRSNSDAVESNSLDEYCSTSNGETSKNDVNSTKVAKITDKEKNSMQKLQNKDKLVPIGKSTLAHFEVTTKICKNSPPLDIVGLSLPSTSNAKKKKRPKKFDSEDGNSGVSPPKLLEMQEHNDEYGVRRMSSHEHEETPDSDDMVVENEMKTNDYLNARFCNFEQMEESDTEYLALLQSEAPLGNNDDQNMNESDDHEVNVINAVELASREALFDPDSQVSLLDDFNISDIPYVNIDLDDINNQNIVLHNINMMASNAELALPMSINPFPNWLLQMLIAEEGGDDAEAHDEPHFYCQGDGLGVHPSFASEDVDDDSSSDSSLAVSTNDEAEAEPSESEIEVGSLPFDSTSGEALRQDRLRLEITGGAIERPPLANASATLSAGTSSGTESTEEYFDTVEVEINEATNDVKPLIKNCKE